MADDLNCNELGIIRLASPCSVKWKDMKGDDAIRHCDQCRLNVYKVEHLTSFQVRDLLIQSEGRVCMQFFRRFDGTLLTSDCPRGMELLRFEWRNQSRRANLRFANVAVAMAVTLGLFCFVAVGLFGDNLRRLFGMSYDGGMGGPEIAVRNKPGRQEARITDFARERQRNRFANPRP